MLTLLFGGFAFMCAIGPLLEPGSGHYLITTAGLAGAAAGFAAWRMSRRAVVRVLAVLGIVLGVVGSAGMLARVMSIWTPPWQTPSAISQPVRTPIVSEPTSAPSVSAEPALPPEQVAGTIVHLIEAAHLTWGGYPDLLVADRSGLVATPAGAFLLPVGDSMAYIPWDDGRGYELQITTAAGAIARYSSSTGVVVSG